MELSISREFRFILETPTAVVVPFTKTILLYNNMGNSCLVIADAEKTILLEYLALVKGLISEGETVKSKAFLIDLASRKV